MKENENIESAADDESDLAQLGILKTTAPDDVAARLQKRMRTVQLGKDLAERQAFAFWSVVDAFLRLLFAPPKKKPIKKTNIGE